MHTFKLHNSCARAPGLDLFMHAMLAGVLLRGKHAVSNMLMYVCLQDKRKPARRGQGSSGGDLSAELACLGLRVKQITADGNCFFRSLGDQLEVRLAGPVLISHISHKQGPTHTTLGSA